MAFSLILSLWNMFMLCVYMYICIYIYISIYIYVCVVYRRSIVNEKREFPNVEKDPIRASVSRRPSCRAPRDLPIERESYR